MREEKKKKEKIGHRGHICFLHTRYCQKDLGETILTTP
jgi:CRISPR/Cas system-associated endonuclease/helicase Cas3